VELPRFYFFCVASEGYAATIGFVSGRMNHSSIREDDLSIYRRMPDQSYPLFPFQKAQNSQIICFTFYSFLDSVNPHWTRGPLLGSNGKGAFSVFWKVY